MVPNALIEERRVSMGRATKLWEEMILPTMVEKGDTETFRQYYEMIDSNKETPTAAMLGLLDQTVKKAAAQPQNAPPPQVTPRTSLPPQRRRRDARRRNAARNATTDARGNGRTMTETKLFTGDCPIPGCKYQTAGLIRRQDAEFDWPATCTSATTAAPSNPKRYATQVSSAPRTPTRMRI